MKNTKFDDYLMEQLKDVEFKEEFLEARAKSKQALAIMTSREEAGYSQRELAQLAYVPQATVARLKKG